MTSTGDIEHRPPPLTVYPASPTPFLTPYAFPDARSGESAFPQGKALSPLHRAIQTHNKSFWKDGGGA